MSHNNDDIERAKQDLGAVLQEALALHRETVAMAEAVTGPDRKVAKKIRKRSAGIVAGHLRRLQHWYPDEADQRRLSGLEPAEIRKLIRDGSR